jgi:hypothetical protein
LEDWKIEKLENWKIGKIREIGKIGRFQDWKMERLG